MNVNKKYTKIIIWLTFIVLVLFLYKTHQDLFDISILEAYVSEYRVMTIFIYLIILSLLGLFFIPSTPFALAGVLIFGPVEAYLLNIIGILTSSTIVYYFSQYLGLDDILNSKFPGKIPIIRKRLQNKELPVITVWSFLPFVPTDLMIYVASGLRIKLWKCLLGVSIGEGTLNCIYIFSLAALIR